MYALSALGVVAVYRGSGVVNFASGAIGLVGTYVFWILADQEQWPVVPAIVLGVACSGGVGLLTHLFVMRPLRRSSQLAKLVATLGVLITIEAVFGLIYSPTPLSANPFLPHGLVRILGSPVGADRLCLVGICAILTAGLTILYTRSRFGLATTAVAENGSVATAMGLSPDAIAGVNWVIGGALAGIAGICLSPIVGVSTELAALLLLPSLAAAVVGGMRSFTVAAVAGLLIGAFQSDLQRYTTIAGLPDAVPFLVILVVLMVRGSALPSREALRETYPRVTTGRVPWVTAALATLACAYFLGGHLSLTWVSAITFSLAVSLIILSLVVVVGFTGQLSLAQYAIAAAAGLVAAQLSSHGVAFPLAAAGGVAAAAPIGLIVGIPAVRTRGPSLAIATLGLSVVIIEMVFGEQSWTGGGITGISLRDPTIFGLDVNPITYPDRFAILSLVCVVLCCIVVVNIRRGRVGRRMLATRANERAATALGISVRSTKLVSFAVAACIAGVGGVLLTFRQPYAIFSSYQVFDSINAVAYGVVGGIGFPIGSLFGSLLSPGGVGSQVFSSAGPNNGNWIALVGGILLLTTVIFMPDGVAAYGVDFLRTLRGWVVEKLRRAPVEAKKLVPQTSIERLSDGTGEVTFQPHDVHTLEISDAEVRFGGLKAVDGTSFSVTSGEVLGLVGANGAGKTTVIDAITGFVPLSAGSIRLDGIDLRGRNTVRRARTGISRSFQSLELFEDMTVRENILIGCDDARWSYWLSDLLRPGSTELPSEAMKVVRDLELDGVLDRLPAELPFGRRRLVAIARALVSQPSVVLLDEPAAGLDIPERAELGQTIRHLALKSKIAVIVVEHDLDLIRSVADRVVVMDHGRCIAVGRPDDVFIDETVVASYVGMDLTVAEAT
jgi:ABC-type branched-subunit amino acid transport system ATPase component/branched-subunit amino acid ABC-type transport system permease component